jgi:DNA-binding XRE family transcriptional regulator
MRCFALRTIVNLLPATGAIGSNDGIGHLAHRRQQADLCHLHGYVVMSCFIAEGSGHSTTRAFYQFRPRSRDESQHVEDGVYRAEGFFLISTTARAVTPRCGTGSKTMRAVTLADVRPWRRRYAAYPQAVAALDNILRRGLKSIRAEHFKRKEFARRLGLPVQSVINIERGHRNLRAAELFLLAFVMNEEPAWVVNEILRRFETEIGSWRQEWGYYRS